jgi:hypothetical protein
MSLSKEEKKSLPTLLKFSAMQYPNTKVGDVMKAAEEEITKFRSTVSERVNGEVVCPRCGADPTDEIEGCDFCWDGVNKYLLEELSAKWDQWRKR